MDSHEILDRQFDKVMGLIDALLEDIAGEPIGFTLITFPDHHAIYGSNCDRQDVVAQLELLLTHWKSSERPTNVTYN